MNNEEYLIKNTTKEQRELLVKKAFAIAIEGDAVPSEAAVKIVKQYIDGKKELEAIQKEIINMYKQG